MKIYFEPWQIRHRTAMSLEDIRKLRLYYLEVNDKTTIIKLMGTIEKGFASARKYTGSFDCRLVIDIYAADGSTETVAADNTYMYSIGKEASMIRDRNLVRDIWLAVGDAMWNMK